MKFSTLIGLVMFSKMTNCILNRGLETISLFQKCHILQCGVDRFNCNWGIWNWSWSTRDCIPSSFLCDGWKDCPDGSDELDCFCSEDEFQCSYCYGAGSSAGFLEHRISQCIPKEQVSDGKSDCLSRKDENFSFACVKSNGYIDCPWLSPHDEANCSYSPMPQQLHWCECNEDEAMGCKGKGYVGYYDWMKCNKVIDCWDASDETGCVCEDDHFKCDCYAGDPITCAGDFGCIPMSKRNDGKNDCPDGSDEAGDYYYERTAACGRCNVTIRRLSEVLECERIGFPDCDNSTCYHVPSFHCSSENCNVTDVICTSNCADNTVQGCDRGLQCKDGSLIFQFQFCNGRHDCYDKSDEIRNKPGFKCVDEVRNCVLPQPNLHDDFAHCSDASDVDSNHGEPLFHCLDRRLLISNKQVCDGVFDCHDLSDECLCEINLNNPVCINMFSSLNSTFLECFDIALSNTSSKRISNSADDAAFSRPTRNCHTKWSFIKATLCDGEPECRDFSDECNCENPPQFCSAACRDFFPMGDRYCDGFEDEAWIYLNKSGCPKGFDEKFCPNRFMCKTGNKVSIEKEKLCDGKNDCDDESDEKNCSTSSSNPFSSRVEMIESVALRCCFWIMGFIVVAANLYVLLSTAHSLTATKLSSSLRYHNILLLNLSIADCIMGSYLLLIAFHSAFYSGYYDEVGLEWRTSLRCSIIGSLTIISSEASCLIMVLLTGYRLFKVCNPMTSQASTTRKWKLGVVLMWVIAFGFALAPILTLSSDYFVSKIWWSNRFTRSATWEKQDVAIWACRLAKLSNMTIKYQGGYWESTRQFLQEKFPEYGSQGEFGYYSDASVCMPTFYVEIGKNAWEYSFFIITINFLCFLFIAVGYVFIYLRSTEVPAEFRNRRRQKQEADMRRRIFRIIITDFLCWIPICIMAYLSFSGISLSHFFYVISAAVLLPINSALNPLLYSPLPDRLVALWSKMKRRKNQPAIDLDNLN